MAQLDREGHFRATVVDSGVVQSDKGAVMCNLKFALTDMYDPETDSWQDWKPYGIECDGAFCLVTKTGQVMEGNAKSLSEALGWNGNLELLQESDWTGTEVQIQCKADTYNGVTRHKADRITTWDATPKLGARKSDVAKLKTLQAQFGAQFRAIIGVGGASAKPAPRQQATVAAPVAPPPMPGKPSDEIPF